MIVVAFARKFDHLIPQATDALRSLLDGLTCSKYLLLLAVEPRSLCFEILLQLMRVLQSLLLHQLFLHAIHEEFQVSPSALATALPYMHMLLFRKDVTLETCDLLLQLLGDLLTAILLLHLCQPQFGGPDHHLRGVNDRLALVHWFFLKVHDCLHLGDFLLQGRYALHLLP